MKTLLITIGILLSPASASAYYASDYAVPLDLSKRLHSGTIQSDVERSQGYERLVWFLESDSYTDVQKERFSRAFHKRVSRNIDEIRKVVTCSDTPRECVSRKPLAERGL